MKYRIFASVLVLAALAAVAVVFGDDGASNKPAAAPSIGADDKALKSLSIN